jgi:hypothetical protein
LRQFVTNRGAWLLRARRAIRGHRARSNIPIMVAASTKTKSIWLLRPSWSLAAGWCTYRGNGVGSTSGAGACAL